MEKFMQIDISRPDGFGNNFGTTIDLPATPYEIFDVYDMTLTIYGDLPYKIEVVDCELDYLSQFICEDVSLYELNHLVTRLATLEQRELDCFEGMVMMDAVKYRYAPISIDRLINMTHSIPDCQVVYEAQDDAALGKFYANLDFVPELDSIPEKVLSWLDYSKIGKMMREGENGVFTPNGYVVLLGEIAQEYTAGESIPKGFPDYSILLKITKGFFNDPEYDNETSALLSLPADDKALYEAIEKVQAASPEECGFMAVDCLIPSLTEKITDELENSNGDCYGLVNELAERIHGFTRENRLIYKAMLEHAPEGTSLDEMFDLANQTDGFVIMENAITARDYARIDLTDSDIPFVHDLIAGANLENYGKKLMERDNSVRTNYGILFPRHEQTVADIIKRPNQGMEMGGI